MPRTLKRLAQLHETRLLLVILGMAAILLVRPRGLFGEH